MPSSTCSIDLSFRGLPCRLNSVLSSLKCIICITSLLGLGSLFSAILLLLHLCCYFKFKRVLCCFKPVQAFCFACLPRAFHSVLISVVLNSVYSLPLFSHSLHSRVYRSACVHFIFSFFLYYSLISELRGFLFDYFSFFRRRLFLFVVIFGLKCAVYVLNRVLAGKGFFFGSSLPHFDAIRISLRLSFVTVFWSNKDFASAFCYRILTRKGFLFGFLRISLRSIFLNPLLFSVFWQSAAGL